MPFVTLLFGASILESDKSVALHCRNFGNPVVNNPVVNNPIVNNPIVNNPVVNNPVVNNPVVNNPIVNNPIVNNPIVNSPWKIQLVRLRCFFIGDDDYSAISDHVQCHLTNSIIFQIMFSVT